MATKSAQKISRFNYLLGETDAVYHEMALRLGLSDSAMRILYTICDNGNSRSLQEICRCSGLSKQTVNSALRKLEQNGVVCLEKANGKSKTVVLTAAGQQLADRTARRILQLEESIFAAWPSEDVETFLRLTEQFLLDVRQRAETL